MKNLILIPARSGSIRIHDKNIRKIRGKPLLAYTIENALESRSGRVVVSTNCEDITILAHSYGAQTPFIRPDRLATARASSISVIWHALDWFKINEDWVPELVVFCPPTNPFRSAPLIKEMVEKLYKRPEVNSIVTVTKPKTHPFRIVQKQEGGKWKNGVVSVDGKTINDIERTQDWPSVWEGSPACRITRSSFLMDKANRNISKTYDINNFIGHEISQSEAFDIDCEEDFLLAEFLCLKYFQTRT